MRDVSTHFSWAHEKYLESILETNKLWYENINRILNPLLKGVMLDIGNGGVLTYDAGLLREVLAVDVSFKDISKLKKRANLKYIRDDARTLCLIKPNSVDIALFQLVLHHITGRTRKETFDNVRASLRAAMRVLRPGGRIIIVETAVPAAVEVIEAGSYFLSELLLKILNLPMVYLFSRKTINRFLKELPLSGIYSAKISYGARLDILNGLLPGRCILPSWLSIHRCWLFTGEKKWQT